MDAAGEEDGDDAEEGFGHQSLSDGLHTAREVRTARTRKSRTERPVRSSAAKPVSYAEDSSDDMEDSGGADGGGCLVEAKDTMKPNRVTDVDPYDIATALQEVPAVTDKVASAEQEEAEEEKEHEQGNEVPSEYTEKFEAGTSGAWHVPSAPSSSDGSAHADQAKDTKEQAGKRPCRKKFPNLPMILVDDRWYRAKVVKV
jgi:hypothetical protein